MQGDLLFLFFFSFVFSGGGRRTEAVEAVFTGHLSEARIPFVFRTHGSYILPSKKKKTLDFAKSGFWLSKLDFASGEIQFGEPNKLSKLSSCDPLKGSTGFNPLQS